MIRTASRIALLALAFGLAGCVVATPYDNGAYYAGPPAAVVSSYLAATAEGGSQAITSGGQGLTITRLVLKNGAGQVTNTIPVGGDLVIGA